MTAYYNEIDKYCVQWLRNLMLEGLIPAGVVDDRSICEVQASDLVGFTQCHFFAGLGGWAYALRLAGWPDDREVWTGSCPCQPFSEAGLQSGFVDPRHLWPDFFRLISQRRPPTIFGEQVANATPWLGVVRGNMVSVDYAVGAIPLEAACEDAEHFRNRYWFVADRDYAERWPEESSRHLTLGHSSGRIESDRHAAERGARAVEHRASERGNWGENTPEQAGWFSAQTTSIGGRLYLECPDRRWRRVPPPRVRWMGNGIPARVAKLRALGNAIVPQVAAEFIGAYLDLDLLA